MLGGANEVPSMLPHALEHGSEARQAFYILDRRNARRHMNIMIMTLMPFCHAAGPGAEPQVFVGRMEGQIVPSRGHTTFGWDPVFQPEGFQETYAEMDKSVKNTISHR